MTRIEAQQTPAAPATNHSRSGKSSNAGREASSSRLMGEMKSSWLSDDRSRPAIAVAMIIH